MRSILMTIQIVLLLSACQLAPINATHKTLAAIAPEVPEIPKASQQQAAKEMQGGACPALNAIASACLLTRDEARLLK